MRHQRQFLMLTAMILTTTALVVVACAPQAESQSTPVTPQAPPQATSVDGGKVAYSAYCAACHGPEAQGTSVAGSLPGHSSDIIRRQIRAPIGQMPAFSESQLSDAQLEAIVAYIASLPAPENHVEPLEMADALVVHHWMVLFALKAEDVKDAVHHLDHIIDMVIDHEHKEQAEEARALTTAGKLHDAEHEVEEMIVGKAAPEMGMSRLHLELAFSAISARETDDAKHHMEHFMTTASGMEKVKGEEVIKLMDMGDMHEAGHALESMMGMTPHGE